MRAALSDCGPFSCMYTHARLRRRDREDLLSFPPPRRGWATRQNNNGDPRVEFPQGT